MSTRCNVVVRDACGRQLTFYRHSDGYPEGVAPTLGEFLKFVRTGKIRDDVEQAAGWLIVLGHDEYSGQEYGSSLPLLRGEEKARCRYPELSMWKVGAYEPAVGIHPDIEYLYEIDLGKKTLRGWEHDGEKKGREVTEDLTALLENASTGG